MDLEIRWFEYILQDDFVEAIFSDKENKKDQNAAKIVLKKIKDDTFQFSFYYDKKVKHENVKTTNIKIRLNELLIFYRQFLVRLS